MIRIIITKQSEIAKWNALGVVIKEPKFKPDWMIVGRVRGYEHQFSFRKNGKVK